METNSVPVNILQNINIMKLRVSIKYNSNLRIHFNYAFTRINTTIGGLSSKFDVFLTGWSLFDSVHGVDCYAPTCCQSATFVRPRFAFYCPLFFCEKIIINNVAFRDRRDVYAARLVDLRYQ